MRDLILTLLPRRARRFVVRTWARRMITRNAVVIDTETTDLFGRVCEFAAVDVYGNVLVDSLVNPGTPITPGAYEVHGITDQDVCHSPALESVLKNAGPLLGGRPVLAYNAEYDKRVLVDHLRASGMASVALLGVRRWGCLMKARSAFYGVSWAKLDAGHRAAGDAMAATVVLWTLAELPLPQALAPSHSARL